MPASEEVLINDWFQQFPSHSIGSLAFGADGALYATAATARASTTPTTDRRPRTPAGQRSRQPGRRAAQPGHPHQRRSGDARRHVIRIDPDTGAALPDNPRVADPDANGKRIIAHGLRNPFRFTFRPGTSELWIGDVGWNTWEEINRIVDGSDASSRTSAGPATKARARRAATTA